MFKSPWRGKKRRTSRGFVASILVRKQSNSSSSSRSRPSSCSAQTSTPLSIFVSSPLLPSSPPPPLPPQPLPPLYQNLNKNDKYGLHIYFLGTALSFVCKNYKNGNNQKEKQSGALFLYCPQVWLSNVLHFLPQQRLGNVLFFCWYRLQKKGWHVFFYRLNSDSRMSSIFAGTLGC